MIIADWPAARRRGGKPPREIRRPGPTARDKFVLFLYLRGFGEEIANGGLRLFQRAGQERLVLAARLREVGLSAAAPAERLADSRGDARRRHASGQVRRDGRHHPRFS